MVHLRLDTERSSCCLTLAVLSVFVTFVCVGCAATKANVQAPTPKATRVVTNTATPPMPGVQSAFNLRASALVATQPPPVGRPITLAADFAPTQLTNLVGFIEVKTNLAQASWVRAGSLLIPPGTNKQTLLVPWTNFTQTYFRAGYQIINPTN